MAPRWSTPAGFHNRAAAVFGSLADTTASEASPWSLQQEQVFRPGKDADYSSEEEEADAQETERRRTELLPTGMLELDGVSLSVPLETATPLTAALRLMSRSIILRQCTPYCRREDEGTQSFLTCRRRWWR